MQNQTKSHTLKLLCLLTLLISSSCSNTKGWVYRSNSYKENLSSKILKNKSVAVLPFSDKRSNENSDRYNLYLIPLMPFGYQDLSSPESVPVHANSSLWMNYNPKDDFAKAMAEELNSSGLVDEASFANSNRGYDYYIKGELISTEYKGKLFSYGLSIYGPILWVILPATHVANDLEVRLSLIDTKSQKVVFAKNYKSEHYSKIGWIYNLPNDFRYPEMLAGLYKDFIGDISSLKN